MSEKAPKNSQDSSKKAIVIRVATFASLLISAIALTVGRYKTAHFNDAQIDEIIFYFLNGIDGQSSNLLETIQDNLLFLLFIFFLLTIPIIDFYRNKISLNIDLSFLGKKTITKFNPSQITLRTKLIYSLIVLLGSLWFLTSSFGVYSYLISLVHTGQIYEEKYVDPSKADLVFPDKKRNLVRIYLESMENTLVTKDNGGQADDSLIPELESIASDPNNVSFSNLDSGLGGMLPASGTTWTVGAITAQLGGVPLKNSFLGQDHNSMSNYKQFLPGSWTLGDILNKEGYSQTFIMGSTASFGGRDKLLTQHGGSTVKDYEYAKKTGQIPRDYNVWWGYEDSKLFDFAKEELTNLSSTDKPFSLSLLTADTHFTDGYLDKSCPKPSADRYDNVYRCSSAMVAEFVSWIQSQPFADNTTIVITGDHLGMQTSYYNKMITDPYYQRTIYNAFINSTISPIKRQSRQFTSFDIYPSVLASMGVTIKGDRLGLGVNLFSEQTTLVEEYGSINSLNLELDKRSRFYEKSILTDRLP